MTWLWEATSLKKLQLWAQIGSLVAIPIIVAFFGSRVQSEISEQNLKKEYVQVALGILKDEKASKDAEMKEWAIKVLNKYSPVPFTENVLKNLVLYGAFPIKAPPPELLEPPLPYVPD